MAKLQSSRGLAGVLTLIAFAGTAQAQGVARVNLPSSLPNYAAPLGKDFLGLSIESDLWPDWAGQAVGQPNEFVLSAFSNLQARSGIPVPLRVGANSEDVGLLDPSVQLYNVTFPAPTQATPYPEASNFSIGRDFYVLSGNLPAGTKFTWGLNLRALNVTETLAQASQLAEAFYGSRKDLTSHVNLKLVEIGNEPDFYATRGIAGFNVYSYNTSWSAAAGGVAETLNLANPSDTSGSGATYQIGAPADIAANYLWSPKNVLGTGVLDSEGGQYVSTWAQHLYFGARTGNASTNPQSGALMNKNNIRNGMGRLTRYIIDATQAGLKFILGECNSYANHGIPGLSNAGEAAVWLVDFALYSASIGVSQIHLHEGVGYAYNLLQPVPVPESFNETTATPVPKIQMAYYGALIVQEAVGTYTDSETKVTEITANSTNIAAYGIWEGDRLARAVLVNSAPYFGTGTRNSTVVDISGWTGGKTSVKRLYVPYTNATSGLNWAGQSFETADAQPTGDVYEDWLQAPQVTVNATEVVLLCFK